jgi:hypothetical protein
MASIIHAISFILNYGDIHPSLGTNKHSISADLPSYALSERLYGADACHYNCKTILVKGTSTNLILRAHKARANNCEDTYV